MDILKGFPSNYKTPSTIGTTYKLLDTNFSSSLTVRISGFVDIYNNGVLINTYSVSPDDGTVNGSFTIQSGENSIVYTVVETEVSETPKNTKHTATFTIYGVENKLPLKPWTNGEVLERLVQLVEPLQATSLTVENVYFTGGFADDKGEFCVAYENINIPASATLLFASADDSALSDIQLTPNGDGSFEIKAYSTNGSDTTTNVTIKYLSTRFKLQQQTRQETITIQVKRGTGPIGILTASGVGVIPRGTILSVDDVQSPSGYWAVVSNTFSGTAVKIAGTVGPNTPNTFNVTVTLTVADGNLKAFNELAPEYTFTRMNFRECLQTVGGRIHAEPRLQEIDGADCITYDFYGEQEIATYTNYKTGAVNPLNGYKHTTNVGKHDLEQACTRFESYIDNLVNRVNWEQATIGQPWEGNKAGQTLRTATAYTRVSESDTFFFDTPFPIDRPVALEVYAASAESSNGTWYDITGYLYEKTIYDASLSGYSAQSPSKSFALYYTQGEKGIKGFFYKPPDATGSGVLNNYSIINIVEAVSGIELEIGSGENLGSYNNLMLRLKYVPIYSTRVNHGKQYVSDYLPLPRTVNYSQGDNSVETRYFGQNIKSAVQRTGNVEKTITINLRNVNNIPKAGMLYDDEYYISSVLTSCNLDLFQVTLGLSKHFNRKSNYIGTSSYKRIYEVSEVMVQQRHTGLTDYIVITDQGAHVPLNVNFAKPVLLSSKGFGNAVYDLFIPNTNDNPEITIAQVSTATKKNNFNNAVFLPVVSSAFGNVVEFTFECQDNFSAGIRTDQAAIAAATDKAYIYGTGTPYADYYGRAYYLYINLFSVSVADEYIYTGDSNAATTPWDFPLAEQPFTQNSTESSVLTSLNNPIIYRKDSREALKISYSLEFVADGDDIIIGTGLTELNPLCAPTNRQPHLYVLPRRINRFSETLTAEELDGAVDLGVYTKNTEVSASSDKVYKLQGKQTTASGLAWVYAYPVEQGESYDVEDEDGNVSTFYKNTGGEIIIAKNVDIAIGQTVGTLWFTLVHDLFDYIDNLKQLGLWNNN
jgi:hypothetical protein